MEAGSQVCPRRVDAQGWSRVRKLVLSDPAKAREGAEQGTEPKVSPGRRGWRGPEGQSRGSKGTAQRGAAAPSCGRRVRPASAGRGGSEAAFRPSCSGSVSAPVPASQATPALPPCRLEDLDESTSLSLPGFLSPHSSVQRSRTNLGSSPAAMDTGASGSCRVTEPARWWAWAASSRLWGGGAPPPPKVTTSSKKTRKKKINLSAWVKIKWAAADRFQSPTGGGWGGGAGVGDAPKPRLWAFSADPGGLVW